MASISTSANGTRRILFTNHENKRKTLHLGNLPMKSANEIKTKVESINTANMTGFPIDNETALWLARISDELAERLAAVDLIPERKRQTIPLLGAFVRDYIESRTDVKPRTRINLEQAEKRLVEHFGKDRALNSITPADVDRWAIALKGRYAEATAARTIKRARQFFTAAKRARLVQDNPFADVKPGSMHNPDRLFFVTREDTFRMIDAAPCADWRAIIALVRFGGLRCPSELLALTWADVDWERNRFLVRSSKLEHTQTKGKRWVPLFPEILPHLEALFHNADDGTVYVINRYRDSSQNLRTTFEKIIEKAGLTVWPRPFQNLRASRETELARDFPLHVVTSWIGNSAIVAAKHYLSVTDADFEKAIHNDANSDARKTQKTTQTANVGDRQEVKESPQTQTPQGFRHPVASQVNSSAKTIMPHLGLEPKTR